MAAMNFEAKVMSLPQLLAWRDGLREAGRKLVATNGCFDILHTGHVTYLQAARQQGDALVVGVTSDQNVKALKGADRPVNNEKDRADVLAALESVDAVHIFPERDARAFLLALKPDLYAKGGDYTLETINQDERRMLEAEGCKIVILPGVPGKSTSATLRKIATL
ncbi:MAG TPA: adenylyltransferase/cytidyltransferase family protein [Verrucomicrobiae bacterium]|jgi:rfaE bifunctional protein nucleotidyltransferase chain/domain|nr:adenylyltransferase/cytidyltransferase family protein [Verrucomicrobiae bacterium]